MTFTVPGAWTGITEPHCDFCTWAYRDGRMEIKFIAQACAIHGGDRFWDRASSKGDDDGD